MSERIKLYFGGEIAHLYELGYISTDLYQLDSLVEILAEGRPDQADRFFGEKAAPINRFTKLKDKREFRAEIVDVRPGSIELAILVAQVAAAVLMPLVAVAVDRKLNQEAVNIQFQVSPEDTTLSELIDAYARGDFGQGQRALQMLFEALEASNYNVSILTDNSYLIEHVIEKYSRRIVRTMQKYR